MAAETTHPIFDRIGIHVGEILVEDDGGRVRAEALYGIQVDTCARVQSLAQGDQILLTRFAFDEARRSLSFDELNGVDPLTWLNHGPYLLKGVPCSSLAFVQPTSAPDKMERELKRRAGLASRRQRASPDLIPKMMDNTLFHH